MNPRPKNMYTFQKFIVSFKYHQFNLGNIELDKFHDILFLFSLRYRGYKTLVETEQMIETASRLNPLRAVTIL